MPKRNSKGQYIKGHHTSRARRSSSGAIVVVQKSAPRKSSGHKKRHHGGRKHGRRGRRGSGGGMSLTHIAVGAAGLAFLTGDKAPIAQVTTLIDKIPGSKTFGRTATAGLACLAIDRFVKKNKWLRAAGVIGVALAAAQVGAKGSDFKWVGDSDGFAGDVDDDIGDIDVND